MDSLNIGPTSVSAHRRGVAQEKAVLKDGAYVPEQPVVSGFFLAPIALFAMSSTCGRSVGEQRGHLILDPPFAGVQAIPHPSSG